MCFQFCFAVIVPNDHYLDTMTVAASNTANKVPLWMDVLFHDDKN